MWKYVMNNHTVESFDTQDAAEVYALRRYMVADRITFERHGDITQVTAVYLNGDSGPHEVYTGRIEKI